MVNSCEPPCSIFSPCYTSNVHILNQSLNQNRLCAQVLVLPNYTYSFQRVSAHLDNYRWVYYNKLTFLRSTLGYVYK